MRYLSDDRRPTLGVAATRLTAWIVIGSAVAAVAACGRTGSQTGQEQTPSPSPVQTPQQIVSRYLIGVATAYASGAPDGLYRYVAAPLLQYEAQDIAGMAQKGQRRHRDYQLVAVGAVLHNPGSVAITSTLRVRADVVTDSGGNELRVVFSPQTVVDTLVFGVSANQYLLLEACSGPLPPDGFTPPAAGSPPELQHGQGARCETSNPTFPF